MVDLSCTLFFLSSEYFCSMSPVSWSNKSVLKLNIPGLSSASLEITDAGSGLRGMEAL